MDNSCSYLSCPDTGYFSRLVTDYLASEPAVQQFYDFAPTNEGLEQAIAARANFSVDRQLLVDTLSRQYSSLTKSSKTEENIDLLLRDNTYTICTAHQPNLLTGYLYFIYKILHAIKLAGDLGRQYPDKHFVPVFYMGSEDNDIEELGTFRFRGEKYVWDGDGQTGAVGRMSTAGLKSLLQQLFKVLGPPGPYCDELHEMLTQAYKKHATIGSATQYLVNELFGRYGLVVIDPDDAALKSAFIPVMRDELLYQHAQPIIADQVSKLGEHYKIQAHPRPINLFYLTGQLRERIEKQDEKWVVVNTAIEWTEEELLAELNEHPERFSPNVMLRGLFQETILPNVAFIGGGAEVAYWLQLNTLFHHYQVFFPAILLRQSVLFIRSAQSALMRQLDLSIADIFKPENELYEEYIIRHSGIGWQTGNEAAELAVLFLRLKQKAVSIDTTLATSADATLTKMKKQLHVLEQKMLRAEKRKMDVQLQRIAKLKAGLFPAGSLQERVENFTEYYLKFGASFFDVVLAGTKPSAGDFLVISQ